MAEELDPDRDRALFASEDRRYLRKKENYINGISRKAKYNRREAITNRTFGGIVDFTTAQRWMDEDVWSNFTDLAQENEHKTRQGVESAIALFYELYESTGWDFERAIWNALEKAYTHGRDREMAARIVREPVFDPGLEEPDDIDNMRTRIEEKIEADLPLTDHEKAWAAEADRALFEKVREHAKRDSYRRRKEKLKQKHGVESESPEE